MIDYLKLYKNGTPVKLIMIDDIFINGCPLKSGEIFPIVYFYGDKPVIDHSELGEVYLKHGEWRLNE